MRFPFEKFKNVYIFMFKGNENTVSNFRVDSFKKKYGGKINSDKAHKILTLLVKVPGGKSNFIGSKKKNRKISKFKYIRLF